VNPDRFDQLTAAWADLRVAVIGDFCLDRYLEIDPAKRETSLETGLPVHNVVNVRAQPGGAGTILNNLVALGAASFHVVGFCGEDGEGWELRRALRLQRGVRLDHFLQTPRRRTFTYCKPLVLEEGRPPRELNRFDSKNWSPTPEEVSARLTESVAALADQVDAVVVLEQVDLAETGVVTQPVREAVGQLAEARPQLPVIADSRRGLKEFPPLSFKMNAAELGVMVDGPPPRSPAEAAAPAAEVARRNGRPCIITLAEQGLVGADPDGETVHVPALPVRGEIDIVGAGDSVTATVALALAAGGTLREALELAALASSVVIHQLGTTGAATVEAMRPLLEEQSAA
jgi:rfaE bifunctional protein kinase chain/domain